MTTAAKARKRIREAKIKATPHCGTCGGREFIETRVGATKFRICVGCLCEGRRREMT